MPKASRAIDQLGAMPPGARVLDALGHRDDVWLVGGAVRDLMLGREPREIDLVVEGDPVAVADALGARVTDHHERFGTLRAQTGEGTYDIARARTESYAKPGALPDVAPATLREDLRRRDLTVNAIALALDGELSAVPDALEDLGARRLRVLHERSFLDDPTRLWRTVRYAARLGFEVESHTERWAREAVSGGALETVSPERVGAEVRLAMGEPDPVAVLDLASGLGLAELDVDRERVNATLALLPEDGREDLATLGTVLRGPWAIGLTATEQRVLDRCRELRLPDPAAPPSSRARSLRGEPVEAIAVAGGPVARWWLEQGRHVRLEISGADLLAAGLAEGPDLGERLARTLERKLDGEVSGREAELAAALE